MERSSAAELNVMSDIKAVVLSGGLSSRMGTDKGLILQEGTVRSKKVGDLLMTRFSEVYISIRKEQKSAYEKYFPHEKLIFDSDQFPLLRGPLLGFVTICEKLYPDYIFVLACDMIDMHVSVIDLILDRYRNDRRRDCYVIQTAGGFEPMCGIYSAASVISYIRTRNPVKGREQSLHAMLESFNVCGIAIPDKSASYLKNYNYPDQ